MNTMRRQQVRSGRQASFRALNYQPENFYSTTDVGTLSIHCSNCGALKFERETDSLYCLKGKVEIDEFPQLQPFLQHLCNVGRECARNTLHKLRNFVKPTPNRLRARTFKHLLCSQLAPGLYTPAEETSLSTRARTPAEETPQSFNCWAKKTLFSNFPASVTSVTWVFRYQYNHNHNHVYNLRMF